ncbi:MAG: hypothetical protein JNK05_04685 [Myxococcales bacterium]|nr:hypothetical protein [Myxococcales bacterium]
MTNASRRKSSAPVSEVLESEDVREILRDGFFSAAPPPLARVRTEDDGSVDDASARRPLTTARRARKSSKKAPLPKDRPEHYKVICISFYNEDLALLDRVVKDLKKRGFTKANRSAVLRAAMQQFDPAKVSRGL